MIKKEFENISIPMTYMFIGYYKIPKDTAIILDSITVHHLADNLCDCPCDFEIKKKDGEYVVIPDVSKIDLKHSMNFLIKYKVVKNNFVKCELKSEDFPICPILQ